MISSSPPSSHGVGSAARRRGASAPRSRPAGARGELEGRARAGGDVPDGQHRRARLDARAKTLRPASRRRQGFAAVIFDAVANEPGAASTRGPLKRRAGLGENRRGVPLRADSVCPRHGAPRALRHERGRCRGSSSRPPRARGSRTSTAAASSTSRVGIGCQNLGHGFGAGRGGDPRAGRPLPAPVLHGRRPTSRMSRSAGGWRSSHRAAGAEQRVVLVNSGGGGRGRSEDRPRGDRDER